MSEQQIPQSITIPDALVRAYDEAISRMPKEFDIELSLLNRAGAGFALGVASKRISVFKPRTGMIAHYEFRKHDLSPMEAMRGRPNTFNVVAFVAHDIFETRKPDGSVEKQDAEQLWRVLYLSADELLAVFAVMHRLQKEEGWQ